MLVSTLRNQIKFESLLNASTEFDSYIIELINEELLFVYQRHNYSENLTRDTLEFTAGQSWIELPEDFLRLDEEDSRIKFYTDGTPENYRIISKATGTKSKLISGVPTYYQLRGTRIYFFPYDQVLAEQRVDLNYYKRPATVTASSEIPDEWAYIIKATVAGRLLLMKQSKLASAQLGIAKQKFEEST